MSDPRIALVAEGATDFVIIEAALKAVLQRPLDIETRLAQLPKTQKIHKTVREYRNLSGKVTSQWAQVKARCTQAAVFDQQVQVIAQPFSV